MTSENEDGSDDGDNGEVDGQGEDVKEDEDDTDDNDKDEEGMSSSNTSDRYQSDIFQGDGADSVNTSTSEEAEVDEDDMDEEGMPGTEEEYETDADDNEDDDQEDVQDDVHEKVWAEGNIPVIITAREHPNTDGRDRLQSALHHIQTNKRVAMSSELPTIAITNFRSLGPRVHSVKDDILLRGIEVQICSETWERQSNKKLKSDIEELFEMHGLQYILCPRPNKKRGGGAGIIVNTARFYITKLNIVVPAKLEIVWGLLRPKIVSKTTLYKEYLICGFYSPPNYKKNNELQTHIIGTMHHLLTVHPNAAYCIAGDNNSLSIAPIISALPHCKQAVTLNTYKQKILDVIMWNMGSYYSVPYIAPAPPADNPATHVPSDHNNAVACPLAGAGAGARTREYTVKTNRPLPASGIRQYGQWLAGMNWDALLYPAGNTDDQDAIFRGVLSDKMEEVFPQKQCRVSNQDVGFITAELKKIQMYMKREYKIREKSTKYKEMKEKYDFKFKKAAECQLNKLVEDMMEEQPGKAYSAMKKMGARPGDCENRGDFTIASHQNENLDIKESTNRILKYFSSISQKFGPLNIEKLPLDVQRKLNEEVNSCDIPAIQPYQIYEKMKGCKKTKSAVPGELPARLRQVFDVELSEPAAILFNNIAQSGCWPQSWKNEYGTVLKKADNPQDESMLRIISITHQISTLMERFVIDWLLSYIGEQLDRDQFGGQKGHSIAHYIIEIINFVSYNQDLSKPQATLLAGVDISKGFNNIDHCKLVTLFSSMNVPSWLLKIVVSYLSGRTLTLRHRGHTSDTEPMPGGTAAGTPLGLFCFLVLFNKAGPAHGNTTIGQQITAPRRRRKPMRKKKVKWVDDMSLMASLHLPTALVPDTRPVPRPVPYRSRLGLRLPRESNTLQDELDSLEVFTQQNLMSCNLQKTKIFIVLQNEKI